MKTFIALLMLIPVVATAQLEVKSTSEKKMIIGTVKRAGILTAELSYRVIEKDTLYSLLFLNQKYETLIDVQIVQFDGDTTIQEQLFNLFMSVFKDENRKNNDYKVMFKLGDTDCIISTFRSMGSTAATFHCKQGFFMLTEKDVKKLFGKD